MSDRHVNDFYPTPHSYVRAALAPGGPIGWLHASGARRMIWEPCAGDGRLVAALAQLGFPVVAGDIVPRCPPEISCAREDFFSRRRAPASALITNPPWAKIRQFIDHAFLIGVREMALFAPTALWESARGAAQFRRHRPALWGKFTWREDFLGKGKAADRVMGLSVWDRPCAGACEFVLIERGAPQLALNMEAA